MELQTKIKDTLRQAIKILFPVGVDADAIIKKHIWRNKKYVGEYNGEVVSWKGLSANLTSIDFRYRVIFMDVVENILPIEERLRLFGQDFVTATQDMTQFVVMFVLDFPLSAIDEIKAQGFVPREMTRVAHACCIVSPEEFLTHTSLHWAAKVVRLVMLQRVLSIHRKPLEANEVPLQNLLYNIGYLHSYMVKDGLQLLELSRPRRAGNFGHDLHAIVSNPKASPDTAFPLGIEVYTGSIGYHINTIPDYVNSFNLRGMIVIAKDDPFPALQSMQSNFNAPIYTAAKVSDIGTSTNVAIHYLPLQKIIVDPLPTFEIR